LKVVFCGKEHDPRKPSFANELKLMGQDLVDNGNVYFLGYLPKNEQMCLINESIALIQPSKFEGWSTTIEDGIAFGKQIIASDLLVNQEQLTDKGLYFNPNDYKELSGILLSLSEVCGSVNYKQELRVKEFAHKLITLSK
jgi:glycosyltransferase involved in cell wall biosynthesis